MKLKAVEKLCKASGCVRLFDEAGKEPDMSPEELLEMLTEDMDEDRVPTPPRQWISDGVGAYPLDGLPYLDEESICAIFDIDAKKRDKLVVSHKGALPEGMDFTDVHQGDDRLEQLDFQMSLGGDELTLFRDGGGGLVVIKSAYRKPFEAWKECECFKRVDSAGRPYVAVMSSFVLRGLIYPYKIGEQLVETLGAVYNAAGVAAEQERMKI